MKEPTMNEIECTCNQAACYSCRRRQIDETALAIVAREIRICTGMDFDVQAHAWKMANQYRCEQINKLAFESAS
jgi:hypothetical protein